MLQVLVCALPPTIVGLNHYIYSTKQDNILNDSEKTQRKTLGRSNDNEFMIL